MIVLLILTKYQYHKQYKSIHINKTLIEKTYENYADLTKKMADKYEIPQEYLLALIVLESSGRKVIPHRFEPRVFEKLKAVGNGKSTQFEGITKEDLNNKSEAQLKQLASSWGPFQIMGYKSIQMNLTLNDLIGKNGFETAVKWIISDYGSYLIEEDYKNAFHIHNTGKKYPLIGKPKTFHKDYVPRGLKYVEEFHKMCG
ncbi:MAG: hypothetical protein H6607_06170 [Flavobacteriales bacterium]|nr:hypothetical protein [Flavobacteriales bacterium]